jgi:hypothetical protein
MEKREFPLADAPPEIPAFFPETEKKYIKKSEFKPLGT